ncbi:hypothetical protein [Desulfovibrio intestinalis]|uniref:Uncharacterized protein n=1 Tax=Desulfovibrio intestinalis TaxID=58621 RepID=A0A7W8C402_9BACT|nr:hypothetical protein [Desulfovibrio intestinalis]MBB5144027.1 hypothetical protein [Desulfovibrio intestinalis]
MKTEICCVIAWQICQGVNRARRKQTVPQQGRYAAYFLRGYFKTATMASKGRKFTSMKKPKIASCLLNAACCRPLAKRQGIASTCQVVNRYAVFAACYTENVLRLY